MLYCFDKYLPWDYSKKEMEISSMKQNGILYDSKLKVFTDFEGKSLDINGLTIFPRTGGAQICSMNDEITRNGGIPILSNEEVAIIKNWPNYYSTERKCKIFKGSDLINAQIIRKIEEDYGEEIFFKTKVKNFSAVIPVKLLADSECAFYKTLMYHLDDDFIISRKVDILEDNLGPKEYRCFVINNEIYNISRFTTTVLHGIDPEVLNFLECVIAGLKGVFPGFYALDLFEYQIDGQRYLDVLEFNPIQAAGPYLYNSCINKSDDLTHKDIKRVSSEFIDKMDEFTTDGKVFKGGSNLYDYPDGFSNHLRSICLTGNIGTRFVHGMHLTEEVFARHKPLLNLSAPILTDSDLLKGEQEPEMMENEKKLLKENKEE